MRLILQCSKNKELVDFNYNQKLTGILNKWIGKDNHGHLSLYSFSNLMKAKFVDNKLDFPHGTYFYFSAYDTKIIKDVIKGIQDDSNLFNGMVIEKVEIIEDPFFSNSEYFYLASPILIKRRVDNNIVHYIYNNEESNKFLIETLKTKMKSVGLSDESLEISFDKDYSKAKTNLINYKGIKNRVSWCPIIIKGKPETIAFAWNVGLGNSTGIGFGSLK